MEAKAFILLVSKHNEEENLENIPFFIKSIKGNKNTISYFFIEDMPNEIREREKGRKDDKLEEKNSEKKEKELIEKEKKLNERETEIEKREKELNEKKLQR